MIHEYYLHNRDLSIYAYDLSLPLPPLVPAISYIVDNMILHNK
jgi:hypothetical protein